MKYVLYLAYFIVAAGLSSCAFRERIPAVSIKTSSANFKIASKEQHGPRSLLYSTNEPPNTPSGVTISLERQEPLHNTEPRYFIAASGRIQIVSIEDPGSYDTAYSSFTKTIKFWRKLILERPTSADARKLLYSGQLSEIPWMNAGRCFHAKLRYHDYSWGQAISFLTTYVQGKTGGPVNNDMLVLVIQGFTYDGRYAVNAHFEIQNLNLPDSAWDTDPNKIKFSIDNQTEQAEIWLDAQPDSSFSPSFSEYNRLLKSLEIN